MKHPKPPLARTLTCTALATLLTFSSITAAHAYNPFTFGASGGAGNPYGGNKYGYNRDGQPPLWENLDGATTGLMALLLMLLQQMLQQKSDKDKGSGKSSEEQDAETQALQEQIEALKQEYTNLKEEKEKEKQKSEDEKKLYEAGVYDGQVVVENQCGKQKDTRSGIGDTEQYLKGYEVGLSICKANETIYKAGIADGSKQTDGKCDNKKNDALKDNEVYLAGFNEGLKTCQQQ